MSNKINKMTFGELRNELANCTDPVKKEIIRNLMYIRYNQHLAKKEKIKKLKKEYRRKQIHKIKQKIEDKYKLSDLEKEDSESDILDINDFQKEQKFEQEQEQENILYNNNEIPKYNRDKTNTNLMKRLSNDIDINKMKDDNIYNLKKKIYPEILFLHLLIIWMINMHLLTRHLKLEKLINYNSIIRRICRCFTRSNNSNNISFFEIIILGHGIVYR